MTMKKDLYDSSENEYKDLLSSLKGLPKVEAPKNFEMNLQRRINQLKYEEKKGFWAKLTDKLKTSPAIPATAIASIGVAVVLFFLFPFSASNPPIIPTEELTSLYYVDSVKLIEKPLIKPENITKNDVIVSASEVAASQRNSRSAEPQNRENAAESSSETNNSQYETFLASENVYGEGNVDQSLQARPSRDGSTGGGMQNNVSFKGFNLASPQADEHILRAMRQRLDSLSELQRRAQNRR